MSPRGELAILIWRPHFCDDEEGRETLRSEWQSRSNRTTENRKADNQSSVVEGRRDSWTALGAGDLGASFARGLEGRGEETCRRLSCRE